jgi:hypothetical protein
MVFASPWRKFHGVTTCPPIRHFPALRFKLANLSPAVLRPKLLNPLESYSRYTLSTMSTLVLEWMITKCSHARLDLVRSRFWLRSTPFPSPSSHVHFYQHLQVLAVYGPSSNPRSKPLHLPFTDLGPSRTDSCSTFSITVDPRTQHPSQDR